MNPKLILKTVFLIAVLLLLVIMVTTSRQFVKYWGTCFVLGNTAMERGRVFMI